MYTIGQGILCFIAVHKNDKDGDAEWIARKALSMFYWESDDGTPWKKGVTDLGGDVIVVSDPGLLANVTGDAPVFDEAMNAEGTKRLYDRVISHMKAFYTAGPEKIREVGSDVKIDLDFVNDGPVTLTLDSFHRRD
jgi:D-Tyr-tRNAtyr deacylase